jgi:hypothetical protein
MTAIPDNDRTAIYCRKSRKGDKRSWRVLTRLAKVHHGAEPMPARNTAQVPQAVPVIGKPSGNICPRGRRMVTMEGSGE